MSTQTRIYAGGGFSFGEDQAVNNILSAGYSALIVWSVHVDTTGNLILNNTQFVSGGTYREMQPMNLPPRLAKLHKAGVQIIFSVGAGGTNDFHNINTLLNGGVPGPGNPLYDNFNALKQAMVAAGGDIDAIDFDNEDYMDTPTMVNFALMLSNIGYKSVTFCPYYVDETWTDTYTQLLQQKGKDFVSAIHYQCYSGGSGNNPSDWATVIAQAQGNTLLIPGLATNQAQPGPWWDGNAQGGSVVKTPDVAMYGEANWDSMLRRGNYPTVEDAMKSTLGGETFFFYCRQYMYLSPDKVFNPGDAVFFGDRPWWGSAPQCDGYSLSGGCSNIYNINGACPADLQQQFATWNSQGDTINGGFIWLYDSIVSCVLSNCCGQDNETTAQLAADYQQAIVKGLS